MAWGRVLELVVRSPIAYKDNTWTWVEDTVSELDIDFHITRSNVFNNNAAELTVYNANSKTRAMLAQAGSNIILSAGYEDQGTGLIYAGSLIHGSSIKAGTDWVTTINAIAMRSTDKPFSLTPIAVSFAKGTPINTVIDYIGDKLGLVRSGISATFMLPNGWVYAGSVTGAIDYVRKILQSHQMGLFVDIAELVVYTPGKSSDFEALYLDKDSGLLNVQDTTDTAGITQETLQIVLEDGTEESAAQAIADNLMVLPKQLTIGAVMLPKARPNSLLQLKHDTYGGYYIVDTVRFDGNNYGGDFNTSLEVSSE